MGVTWSQEEWQRLEQKTAQRILSSASASSQSRSVVTSARSILKNYSTSFFIVTRFLPPAKRAQVEIIYAAVRYPDEIVDSFPISPEARLRELDVCANDYERSGTFDTVASAVRAGLNCFVAAFGQVVRKHKIPLEYYRAFLDAMRLDVRPRPFGDLADLIESYVYGSATVVGYFLAYVYGPSAPQEFSRMLAASRNLGIALQLTNFLRDVREDKRRGRVYLPVDMLQAEGLTDVYLEAESADKIAFHALNSVLRKLSAIAEQNYASAERNLDAFAPDCRMAIQACINVYRQLNIRIGQSREGILHRESVPMSDKFRVLPASKYWRLPLAYLGAI